MKPGSLAFVALIMVGCGGNKSQTETPANSEPAAVTAKTEFVQDLERICNAHSLSGAPPDSGMTVAGPWLEKNVQTAEAKALLEELKAGNLDRTRDEAKRQNVAPCPTLDPNAQQAAK
jgi:hypothetical protein